MTMIADFLLACGAFGAAFYCYVLAGRLRRFTTLESGMGGAIAVLSAQVDDMTRLLDQARAAATGSVSKLEEQTTRAELAAARLELLVAALHDLPEPSTAPAPLAEEERRLRFVRRRIGRSEEPVQEAAE